MLTQPHNSNKISSLLASRRFWVAISAAIVAFARELEVELDQKTIELIVILAATWIIGDSLSKTGAEES